MVKKNKLFYIEAPPPPQAEECYDWYMGGVLIYVVATILIFMYLRVLNRDALKIIGRK